MCAPPPSPAATQSCVSPVVGWTSQNMALPSGEKAAVTTLEATSSVQLSASFAPFASVANERGPAPRYWQQPWGVTNRTLVPSDERTPAMCASGDDGQAITCRLASSHTMRSLAAPAAPFSCQLIMGADA